MKPLDGQIKEFPWVTWSVTFICLFFAALIVKGVWNWHSPSLVERVEELETDISNLEIKAESLRVEIIGLRDDIFSRLMPLEGYMFSDSIGGEVQNPDKERGKE